MTTGPSQRCCVSQLQKKGHYSAQCFYKAVAEVTIPTQSDVTDYYDVAYLNSVSARQSTMWNCTVQLNDDEVPFKVDTGAKVTVISEDQWKSLGMSEVKLPSKTLHGPDNKPLDANVVSCSQPYFCLPFLQPDVITWQKQCQRWHFFR